MRKLVVGPLTIDIRPFNANDYQPFAGSYPHPNPAAKQLMNRTTHLLVVPDDVSALKTLLDKPGTEVLFKDLDRRTEEKYFIFSPCQFTEKGGVVEWGAWLSTTPDLEPLRKILGMEEPKEVPQ